MLTDYRDQKRVLLRRSAPDGTLHLLRLPSIETLLVLEPYQPNQLTLLPARQLDLDESGVLFATRADEMEWQELPKWVRGLPPASAAAAIEWDSQLDALLGLAAETDKLGVLRSDGRGAVLGMGTDPAQLARLLCSRDSDCDGTHLWLARTWLPTDPVWCIWHLNLRNATVLPPKPLVLSST